MSTSACSWHHICTEINLRRISIIIRGTASEPVKKLNTMPNVTSADSPSHSAVSHDDSTYFV